MKNLIFLLAAVGISLAAKAQELTNVTVEAKSPETVEVKPAAAKPTVPNSGPMTIDLAAALRLADGRNYRIAIARESVKEADAHLRRMEYLLIPSLTVGGSWTHQEGRLQETGGRVGEVSRNAGFIGAGAGAVGAGTVAIPGLQVSANLADAYFEPLAARQDRQAAKAASDAMGNVILLQTAEAYFNLVRARAGIVVAAQSLKNTAELAKVTADFASSGEGLQSDAQRMRVEELMRARESEKANEEFAVAAARLSSLLHLAHGVELSPAESSVTPVAVQGNDQPLAELVALALQNRPEVKHGDAIVKAASSRVSQARYSPVIPNVTVGASAGGFGGGIGGGIANTGGRTDFSALLYWRLENFGLGNRERVNERKSLLEQAKHSKAGIMDLIIFDVKQAHAQVSSRRRQIGIAEEAVQSAVKSFELNRSRIFQKQGLPIEVLQAIQSLANARRILVDTVADYNVSQFSLYAAIGRSADEAAGGKTAE